MPSHEMHAHPAATTHQDTPPEMLLIAAILRQAVGDAQGKGMYGINSPGAIKQAQETAQAWLQNRTALAALVELAGLDVDEVQPRLLRAAGMGGREGCTPPLRTCP